MREILFRGQLRRKGEKVNMAGESLPSIWKYGGVAQYGGGAVIYQAEPEIKKFPVYGDTVGQYTGLKDKNGSMIFEGDIVKADNGHIGFVDFIQGEFVKHCECPNQVVELYGGDNVVIGNIYDNPELLGGEENA